MQEKRASVKDIAARLNISLSTVHKALTGKPGVSEKRRAQVLEVAQELGYVVNTAAQSLARKGMKLGVIMPAAWQEYFSEMKIGIEREIAELSEYKVTGEFLFICSKTKSSEISDWIKDNKIDAALVCSSSKKFSMVITDALEDSNVFAFWVGGGIRNANSICNITIDAPMSGKMAADFFESVCGEKVCAAAFTGSLGIEVHKAKVDAFSNRIMECGELAAIYETEDNEEIAYAQISELFSKRPDVNCIYISTSTSCEICRYIEERGLTKKVCVVGTDVFDTLRGYMKRGVMNATIYQNQQKVGKYAVRKAYEFLHMKTSYANDEKKQEENFLITPRLLLKANIE